MANLQQQYQDYTNQAQGVMKQLQGMGTQTPDFKQAITQAYQSPVLQPLVNERANLESQYLPAMFQPFTQQGTGAADMSPAAKLAAMGSSLGRLTSRIGANQDIQGFYGDQINNLANTYANSRKDQIGALQNQYGMLNGAANDAYSHYIQQQQLGLQAAARNDQLRQQKMMEDYLNKGRQAQTQQQQAIGMVNHAAGNLMNIAPTLQNFAQNTLSPTALAIQSRANAYNTRSNAYQQATGNSMPGGVFGEQQAFLQNPGAYLSSGMAGLKNLWGI